VREGGQRRWRRGQRGRRLRNDNRRKSGLIVVVAVASLEEVVDALAAHHRLEGQGPLEALQLDDVEIQGGELLKTSFA